MLGNATELATHDVGGGAACDVAIVGGGAAGLTLAAALIGSGLSVAVFEAGGERPTKAGDDAYRGEVADPALHPYLHHFRVRALGGSSRIWGGRCLPYDPIDFAARDWVPGPGWPLPYETLLPYYVLAQDVLEAGAFDYDPGAVLPGAQAEYCRGLDGPALRTRLERFSRPTNLWRRTRERIAAAANVRLYSHTAVTGIDLAPDGRRVENLALALPDGRRAAFRARHVVVATGGLETARLLLASDAVTPGGIGNHGGHLGRHYMSHLAASAGTITFAGPANSVAFDYERDREGIYVRRRIWVSEAAQRAGRLLNVAFRTHLPDPADPGHGDPILSAMYLVKDLVLYEYSRKMREARPGLASRLRHVGNVLRRPHRLAQFGIRWLRHRILADRKLPSVVLGSTTNSFTLEFHAEQAPNPDSRLTLSDERDALGMRRLRVDWRVTGQDLDSLVAAYELLDAELTRTGTGILTWSADEVRRKALAAGAYGGHHLGTARMSTRPEDGVVDTECRVHGVDNLFVASGAVLPTSSQANPTLTIVALTLRLADLLKAYGTGDATGHATAHATVARRVAEEV